MRLALLAGGGALAAVAGALGYLRSEREKRRLAEAVSGASEETRAAIASAKTKEEVKVIVLADPTAPAEVKAAAEAGDVEKVRASSWYTGMFKARLTTYHPLDVKTEAERKMEGRPVDRKGKPLNYLEDAIAGKAPWVSVAGDWQIFPYGQAIRLDAYPNVVFRVTDTGGHFFGAGKLQRIADREPLDIAVRSKATKVPTTVVATIVKGDHLDKAGKAVAVSRFKGQDVTVGALHMLGAS